MSQADLTAKWTREGLLLTGNMLSQDDQGGEKKNWSATPLAGDRFLLFAKQSDENPASADGFALCSSAILFDLLLGINHRSWSGMVLVDLGFAKKKLYFSKGDCVFAASDSIDDRLGEVIFRAGLISVEQLANFSVQVDRANKFGQVLIRSYEFNNTDLWVALQTQVREILYSIFLVDRCYVEINQQTPRVEIAFEEGTEAILEAAYSHGSHFRAFRRRIDLEKTKVMSTDVSEELGLPKAGTFASDFRELCNDAPLIRDVLTRSKLDEVNTLVAIQKLVARGYLRLEGLAPPAAVSLESPLVGVKSAVDTYQQLHQICRREFDRTGHLWPERELNNFALGLNSDGDSAIYLHAQGALLTDSINNILHQCVVNPHRVEYFRNRLVALTRYLLQMAGDTLPAEAATIVKKEFQEIIS